MSVRSRHLLRLGVVAAATVTAVLGAELFVRVLDGYALTSIALVRGEPRLDPATPPGGKFLDVADVERYVTAAPVAAGVMREWFVLDPMVPPASPVDPELERRYWRHKGHELESVYQWNRAYVREAVCEGSDIDDAVFRHLDDTYVFDAPDGASRPSYRFLPRTHYPSGLRTNAFGWRGAEIDPAKDARKIRLAFVGASTTVGAHADAFSYPEHIGRWFTEWARTHHPELSVDVINAGREGIDSTNIAAIVDQELAPLAPDVVVYYEGANQFWPSNFVANDLPLRLLRTMAAPPWIQAHSALASRIAQVGRRAGQDGSEPPKPPLWVRWPADLSEGDPPLDDPRLPVQLPAILSDLDKIRVDLERRGAALVLSSFVWLAFEGMQLDPVRDAFLFDYLNRAYWPFSYAHIRRYVDFENRVFRKYAALHGLPFVDVAAAFPNDPRLFVDAIHMTAAGVRLYAWLAFQQLVPHIEAAIASGRIPRTAAHPRAAFPSTDRHLVSIAEIRSSCPR
jgi:hypothetical protein